MLAQANNTKQQIDDYLNILDFSKYAEKIGVKNTYLINSYLNRVCFKSAISSILYKNQHQAWRILGAMLFYPQFALRNSRFYILLLLLIFYPVSILFLKIIKSLTKLKVN
jgi:hypothetical protein